MIYMISLPREDLFKGGNCLKNVNSSSERRLFLGLERRKCRWRIELNRDIFSQLDWKNLSIDGLYWDKGMSYWWWLSSFWLKNLKERECYSLKLDNTKGRQYFFLKIKSTFFDIVNMYKVPLGYPKLSVKLAVWYASHKFKGHLLITYPCWWLLTPSFWMEFQEGVQKEKRRLPSTIFKAFQHLRAGKECCKQNEKWQGLEELELCGTQKEGKFNNFWP